MRWKFFAVVGSLELVFIILMGIVVEYGDKELPIELQNEKKNHVPAGRYRALFQDMHAMIFFGIGFLYTFLCKYSYSGIAMTMLLGTITVQTALISQNVWYMENGKLPITPFRLIRCDYAAASSLIALGGIFGKTNPLQMVIFVILETIFYSTNTHYCETILQVRDFGEAVCLHLFAAIFGLSAAYVLDKGRKVTNNPNETPNYLSNIFCLMGTVYLWAFWPTFNAFITCDNCKRRSVVNTTLALLASCVTAFLVSSVLHKKGKFQMMHIQNATLAGGVAIGSVTDLVIEPVGATALGAFGGIISTLGFTYSTPFLERYFKIHDPCGIHSLHAIPGFVSGLAGAIVSLTAYTETYGDELYYFYPAMAPNYNVTHTEGLYSNQRTVINGINRSNLTQCAYQLLYILITMGSGLLCGLATGVLLRMPFFQSLTEEEMYTDEVFFALPETTTGEHSSNHLKNIEISTTNYSKRSSTNDIEMSKEQSDT